MRKLKAAKPVKLGLRAEAYFDSDGDLWIKEYGHTVALVPGEARRLRTMLNRRFGKAKVKR